MKALLRDLSLASIVRLAGIMGSLVFGILAARWLGPEGYGLYGTVMAVVALMTVAGQLGLIQLTVREVGQGLRKPDKAARARTAIWWFSVAVLLASGAVIGIGSLVLLLVWPGEDAQLTGAYLLGFALVPIATLLNILSGALIGADRPILGQIYAYVARPVLVALALAGVVLWRGDFSLQLVLWLQLGLAVALLIPCLIAVRRSVLRRLNTRRWDSDAGGWARSALSLFGVEAVRVLEANYALLLLGVLATQYDVGILRVALSVALIIALPHAILTLNLSPRVLEAHSAQDTPALQSIAAQSAVISFCAGLAASLGVAVIGAPVLELLFGAPYQEAWWVLLLLSAGYAITGWFGVASLFFNLCGHERAYLVISAIAMAAGVLGFLLLHPTVGLAAAGYAFCVTALVRGLLCAFEMRRRSGLVLGLLGAGLAQRTAQ